MTTLKDYQVVGEIGRGAFGIVYKVKYLPNNQVLVLKQVDISKLDSQSKKQAQTEANILKEIRSPYIVRYYESFVEKNSLNIVMEFCAGGDFEKYLKRMAGRPLKEETIWKFFVQMAIGLRDIHSKRVLHRDIKALNIFLTHDENIRIGDLGVAKEMKQDFARTVVGTPYYLSPEMCQSKPYNEKTDIWALGCVLYQMCTGHYPFEAQNLPSLTLKIIKGKYSPIPSHYSNELSNTVGQCLSVDPKRRPSAAHLLEKPFIKDFIKSHGIETSVQRTFEKEISAIVGNTVPLEIRKNTPPKPSQPTEPVFKPAERADVNIQSIVVGKWKKSDQPQNNYVPQFLKKRKSEPLIVSPPQEYKKLGELVPPKTEQQHFGIPQTPSQKLIPKSPQNQIKLKDFKEEKRIKEQQRQEKLRLEAERYNQQNKMFQKKQEEERKKKAEEAKQKRLQHQELMKERVGSQPILKPQLKKWDKQQRPTVISHGLHPHRQASQPVKPVHSHTPSIGRKTPAVSEKAFDQERIPDGPDSEDQKNNQMGHQPDHLRRVVHMVQEKVEDDEIEKDFGDVVVKPKVIYPGIEKSRLPDLPNPNLHILAFEEKRRQQKIQQSAVSNEQLQKNNTQQTKSTEALPTFYDEMPESFNDVKVCQYDDPNDIVEQLEELDIIESSLEEDIQDVDEEYLEDEQAGKDRVNLDRMLSENNKRRVMLSELIRQKQEQLFAKIKQDEYNRLRKVVKEGEEKEVQEAFHGVKAFQDPKVLPLFYKILLYDSQMEVCDRTIKQITERLAHYK